MSGTDRLDRSIDINLFMIIIRRTAFASSVDNTRSWIQAIGNQILQLLNLDGGDTY
jgi:hypothetical protein